MKSSMIVYIIVIFLYEIGSVIIMINVLFICMGNICRSPMAEFIFRDMVENHNLENLISAASAATGRNSLGDPVHDSALRELKYHHIKTFDRTSVQMKKADYEHYDYLIGMDSKNIRHIMHILGEDPSHKVYRLLDFTNHPEDIIDPYATWNFQRAYQEIFTGCQALLQHIVENDLHLETISEH